MDYAKLEQEHIAKLNQAIALIKEVAGQEGSEQETAEMEGPRAEMYGKMQKAMR